MYKRASLVIVVILFMLSNTVLACQVDADCSAGSRCIKTGGQLNGFCEGGRQPGNQNDKNPYRSPGDYSGKKGNACTLNIDCGIGGRCVKGNNIYGICE
ncbi:MAG: hypothetical protein WC782_03815 [Methylococcaceae bacterium]|jgi:hypothetical protein